MRFTTLEGLSKPVLLLILGVHRSGTSTVSRLLECLGAAPSSNLMKPHPQNPKGFFEDADIWHFHESELLPALGMRWNSLAPPDWSRLDEPARSCLLEKATVILNRNFSPGNRLFVLKDPRIGVLLPFWREAIRLAGFEAIAVCAVRDPLSVAHYLRQRNGFTIEYGSTLYASQWLTTLASIGGMPTAFIPYDEVFTDVRPLLTRLASQLDLPLPDDLDQQVLRFQTDFLDDRLRHASFTPAQLEGATEILPAARTIHLALLEAADPGMPCPSRDTLSPWHEWLAQSVHILREHDRLHAHHLEHIWHLKAEWDMQRQALESEVSRLKLIATDIKQHILRQTEEIETLTSHGPDDQDLPSRMQEWVKRQNRLLHGAAKDQEQRIEEMQTIRDSQRFDPAFYLDVYPDVRSAGVDPLEHFVRHGWKEGRNPSAAFDTRRYIQQWLSHDWIDRNPLFHYLVEGKDKGCTPFNVVDDPSSAR